jgi:pilus assembly protein FimV
VPFGKCVAPSGVRAGKNGPKNADQVKPLTLYQRALAAFAVAAIPTIFCATSHAITLGAERVSSYYGQPLRVEIPINIAFGEQWDASCFKLVQPSRRDGAVSLRQGQLDVSPDGQRLLIRSPFSVEELAVRFAIDVGCETPLRREYTVLLDPSPVNLPSVPAATSASSTSTTAREAPTTVTNAATIERSAATLPRSSRPARARRATEAATNSPETTRRSGQKKQARNAEAAQSRLVLKGSDRVNIDDASLAALAVPRLRISGDLPSWAASELGTPGATGSAPLDELAAAIAKERRARLAAAPIEEDLPARLEADLVVAKKRLAELQVQLNAASPKETGVSSASTTPSNIGEKSAAASFNRATPKEAVAASSFDWRDWVWIPALAAILGLVAFLWRQRSTQREARTWSAADAATVVRAERSDRSETSALRSDEQSYFDDTRAGSPPTVSEHTTSSATIVEASKRLENPLFHPNQTASSVDVTVLSHITDEAQVYADLGRTNEAIEILAHHIDTSDAERPSPAPWLMLFELFRKANRRDDYDRLAPMFRKNFNGRLPEWDSYSDEMALDDGLESFPHLIARIEREWGTPPARILLDELLYDNRGGSRLGFSLSAYRDLLLLLQLHDQMAHDGTLDAKRAGESPGANDEDGTPKWDLSLDMIEPPKPGELDEFLSARKPRD